MKKQSSSLDEDSADDITSYLRSLTSRAAGDDASLEEAVPLPKSRRRSSVRPGVGGGSLEADPLSPNSAPSVGIATERKKTTDEPQSSTATGSTLGQEFSSALKKFMKIEKKYSSISTGEDDKKNKPRTTSLPAKGSKPDSNRSFTKKISAPSQLGGGGSLLKKAEDEQEFQRRKSVSFSSVTGGQTDDEDSEESSRMKLSRQSPMTKSPRKTFIKKNFLRSNSLEIPETLEVAGGSQSENEDTESMNTSELISSSSSSSVSSKKEIISARPGSLTVQISPKRAAPPATSRWSAAPPVRRPSVLLSPTTSVPSSVQSRNSSASASPTRRSPNFLSVPPSRSSSVSSGAGSSSNNKFSARRLSLDKFGLHSVEELLTEEEQDDDTHEIPIASGRSSTTPRIQEVNQDSHPLKPLDAIAEVSKDKQVEDVEGSVTSSSVPRASSSRRRSSVFYSNKMAQDGALGLSPHFADQNDDEDESISSSTNASLESIPTEEEVSQEAASESQVKSSSSPSPTKRPPLRQPEREIRPRIQPQRKTGAGKLEAGKKSASCQTEQRGSTMDDSQRPRPVPPPLWSPVAYPSMMPELAYTLYPPAELDKLRMSFPALRLLRQVTSAHLDLIQRSLESQRSLHEATLQSLSTVSVPRVTLKTTKRDIRRAMKLWMEPPPISHVYCDL